MDEVSESSTETEQPGTAQGGEVADQQTAQDVQPSESSTENTGAESPKSSLDAVTAALAKMQEKQDDKRNDETALAESPTAKDGDPKTDHPKPDSVDEEATDPDEKDLAKLPATTQKRIRRLLGERKALTERLGELEPDAVVTKNLREWGKANGVSSEDFQNTFSIMALAKTNPRKALELLEPIRANLMREAGHELPADLLEQVDTGTLTEDAAKELSILRADAARRDALDKDSAERRAAERQNSDANEFGARLAKAVEAAEKRLRASDPDYDLIQEFVKNRVESQLMRQPPANEKEAVEQFLEAVKTVKATTSKLAPARRPTTMVTGGSGSTNNRPVPKSALEAVNRALGVVR